MKTIELRNGYLCIYAIGSLKGARVVLLIATPVVKFSMARL